MNRETAIISPLQTLIDASDSDCDLLSVLTLLRENVRELQHVLSQRPILRHPLGFLQMPLGEIEGRRIRIHFWRSDCYCPRYPYWPLHAHPYPLRSLVLCGAVHQIAYSIDTAPTVPTHRIYEVDYEANGSTRRPTDHLVNAIPTYSYVCSTGSYYDIPIAEYHQTMPHASPGITLVVTGRTGESPARVLGDVGNPTARYYPALPAAGELREACVRDLQQLLS